MKEDINIKKFFKTISDYRWSIIVITLLSTVLATLYLYTQVSIYSSYSIIKVKDSHDSKSSNPILNLTAFGVSNVKEDITLLKTFYMNRQALDMKKVDFQVQYYNNKKYKEREIYNRIPIKIDNIEIFNRKFLEEKLTLTPQKDGYRLKFKYSFISKLKKRILGREIFRIKRSKLFRYNETITTEYFKLKVNKLSNFNMPIDIKINGDYRYIYENIIKKRLKISQLEEEVPLIKILYKDNIQARAIDYIDSLTSSFIKESILNKNEQNNKVLEFITHELDVMKNRLSISEKKLENYRISNDVIQPSVQASTLIKELSDIDIQISENRLKKRLVANLVKLINQNYSLDAIAPSLMELDERPTLKLIETLQENQLKRTELLAEFTQKHPDVRAIQEKINSTRRKIRLNIQNLQRHIGQKDSDLKKLKITYEKRLKRLPTKERKLINIKRNYEVSSKMYNFLLEKQAENEIVKVATLSDYKIIDSAYSSNEPVSPKYKIVIIAFTLLGLITGIIIAFVRNALNSKIKDRGEIESSTEIPIYGAVPAPKGETITLEVYNDRDSILTERYRTLRTNLQLSTDDSGSKVILFTSTIAGEGKNITASNLSATLEMAEYKTALIDLDMRTPTIDKIFKMSGIKEGISSYLSGKSQLHQIIYRTKYNNLHIIPVGEIPANPSELILSSNLTKLIDELKESNYRYIIINSVPFGDITDTKHIMRHSDINLTLLRENYSEKKYISNLNSMVNQDGILNMGIVYMYD